MMQTAEDWNRNDASDLLGPPKFGSTSLSANGL
jgi:hypothetical protein